jgi:exopolysaccharide production protein ExoZ
MLESSGGDVTELLKSLFFIPYYSEAKGVYHPIVYVGWTLNYEMFFYLLFGAFIFLGERAKVVAVTAAIMVALVVIGLVYDGGRVFEFYTSPILLEFVGGMGLALYWQKMKLGVMPVLAISLACLLLFAAFDPLRVSVDRGFLIGPVALVLVAAAMAAENAGHIVRNRFVLLLGAASYSLYLTHAYVLGALGRIPLPGVEYMWPVLVFVVAFGSFYVVEKPTNDYLRKRIDAGRLRSLSSA